MYAVIETGGKQYRVEVGSELEIEQLTAGPGDTVSFDRILLVAGDGAAAIGTPVVANAQVSAEVVRRDRGEKVISFKYRPKARRRVKKGHRQELTVVRISDIVLDGKSAAADVQRAKESRRSERAKLEEAARRQAEADAALAAKLAADKSAAAKAAAKPEAKAAAKPEAKAAAKVERKPQAKADGKGKAKATSGKTAVTEPAGKGDASPKPRARDAKSRKEAGTSDTKTTAAKPRTTKKD